MTRVAPLLSWRRALTSPASNATKNERHVALQVSLYMSAAGDGAWPGNARLAAETLMGRSTVRDALRGLDEKGWLTRHVNRGRGRSNVYEARIPRSYYDALDPREKRRLLAVFGLDDPADPAAGGEGASGPEEGRDGGSLAAAAPGEKRQETAVFGGGKTAEGEHENRQDRGRKTAGGLAPNTTKDQARTTTTGAVAVDLARDLAAIGVSARLRRAALAEPERARAWLDVATAAADTNPAGYFRRAFESGDWPAPAQAPGFSRRRWVEETSWRLDREDAHAIIDEWRDLDQVERSMLHEYADEVRDAHADELAGAPITVDEARGEADPEAEAA